MNTGSRGAGLAAAVMVLVAGCGGGTADGDGSPATRRAASATGAATSAKPDLSTIEGLRAAVRDAGVSCPDTAWKPNLAPDVKHATGEGVCAGTLTLVVFKDRSQVGQAQIRADLAGADLKHGLDTPDAPEKKILAGPGWGALGAEPTIKLIRDSLGGKGISD